MWGASIAPRLGAVKEIVPPNLLLAWRLNQMQTCVAVIYFFHLMVHYGVFSPRRRKGCQTGDSRLFMKALTARKEKVYVAGNSQDFPW
jgi:hypothetical protein